MSAAYDRTETFAPAQDAQDPLAKYRQRFIFPKTAQGSDCIYFAGNSLGLQPKKAREYVLEELEDWGRLGVEGHQHARHPWLPYHENLTAQTARLVGALPEEVVVMNTLTVNLHLMMVSFYRPTQRRHRILVEAGAFPSDQYAVASQAKFHGFTPEEAVLELRPRMGEDHLRSEDILEVIEREGASIALVLLGGVNYLTGQAMDVATLTRAAHKQGCRVGFDLAHGAGNLRYQLHDAGSDFAVWCGYKYLNGGPGGLAGCFVHARHATDSTLVRFSGWWGHDKARRFLMESAFHPIPGAEGWQLSNPPILQLAALRASMEIFDEAGMEAVRAKSEKLTGYLEFLLQDLPGCQVVTPKERGAQLSLRVSERPKELQRKLSEAGVICDFREPDILRAAPAPLYCTFEDVHRFGQIFVRHLQGGDRG